MNTPSFNIETAFSNPQPSAAQAQKIDRVLTQAKGLAQTFIHECGDSPETQHALNLLQQSTYAVRSAILTSSTHNVAGRAGGSQNT